MTLSHFKMPRTNGIRTLLILAIAASGLTVGTLASAAPEPFKFRRLPADKCKLALMNICDTTLQGPQMWRPNEPCDMEGGTVEFKGKEPFCKTSVKQRETITTEGKPKPKPGCTLRPDSPC